MSETTLDLTVETELPSRVLLRYGRGDKLSSRDREAESVGPLQNVHRLHIVGLRPGTLHHYQVALLGEGSRRADLPMQTFHTPPGAGMPLKVVVYGDSRSGHPVHAQVMQAILAEDPDLVLHTGISSSAAPRKATGIVFAVTAPLLSQVPVYVSPGNHDYAIRKQGRCGCLGCLRPSLRPKCAAQDRYAVAFAGAGDDGGSAAPLGDLSTGPRGYYSFDVRRSLRLHRQQPGGQSRSASLAGSRSRAKRRRRSRNRGRSSRGCTKALFGGLARRLPDGDQAHCADFDQIPDVASGVGA